VPLELVSVSECDPRSICHCAVTVRQLLWQRCRGDHRHIKALYPQPRMETCQETVCKQ
jgi:hypothetical protein